MTLRQIVARLLKVDGNVEVTEMENGVNVVLNTLTSDAIRTVASMREIKGLELRGDLVADDEAIMSLREMRNVEFFGIRSPNATRLLTLFPELPTIQSALVVVNGISGIEVFNALKCCKHLRFIDIWLEAEYAITDECLLCLTEMTELRRLDLVGCTVVADFGLLRRLSSFERLEIANTRIGRESLNSISKCVSLKTLDVSNTEFSDEVLELCVSCKNIVTFSCKKTQISESAVSSLAKFPSLQDLWLDVYLISAGSISHLSQCRELKRLSVFGANLDRKLERLLRKSLPKCEIRLYLTDR